MRACRISVGDERYKGWMMSITINQSGAKSFMSCPVTDPEMRLMKTLFTVGALAVPAASAVPPRARCRAVAAGTSGGVGGKRGRWLAAQCGRCCGTICRAESQAAAAQPVRLLMSRALRLTPLLLRSTSSPA